MPALVLRGTYRDFFLRGKGDTAGNEKKVLHAELLAKLVEKRAGLIWISAPGGFGKSVLARQLAESSREHLVWYNVDSADNDPAVFFNVLKQAVCVQIPAAEAALPTFSPEELLHLDAFAPRFFSALIDVFGERLLLVLDGMEKLDSQSRLHNVLVAAMSKSFCRMTICCCSRQEPPIVWERLRADGQLYLADQRDLTVDINAIREFLQNTRWKDDSRVANWLFQQSAGWFAGIKLLLDHLEREPNDHLSSGDHSFPAGDRSRLFRYFAAEVFNALEKNEQQMLLQLSFLSFIPERLVDDLCQSANAMYGLRALHARQFFISRSTKSSNDGYVYTLHDLLKEFLSDEFSRLHDESKRHELVRHAAIVMRDAGWRIEAIRLFALAEDWQSCVDFLEQYSQEIFVEGRLATLLGLFEQLPANLRESTLKLQYWYGVCLLGINQSSARQLLEKAYSGFKQQGDVGGMTRCWAAIQDALWIDWRDSFSYDQWIDELGDLKKRIDNSGKKELTAVLAKGAFVALTRRRMDHTELPYWESENLRSLEQGLSPHDTLMRCVQMLLHYTWGVGDRARATLVFQYLNGVFDKDRSSIVMNCLFHVGASAYHHQFSPSRESALNMLQAGLAVSTQGGWKSVDIVLINTAVFVAASKEYHVEINRYLEMLEERLDENSRPNDVSLYYGCRALGAWVNGDNEQALLLVEKGLEISEASGHSFMPVYSRCGLARVLASSGKQRAARAQLSIIRKVGRRYNSDCMQYMAHMIGADIAFESGQVRRAMKYFNKALSIGSRQRYFLDVWVRRANVAVLLEHAIDVHHENGSLIERWENLRQRSAQSVPQVFTLGRCGVSEVGANLPSRKQAKVPLSLLINLVATDFNTGLNVEQVIEYLWPDVDQKKAYARLKTNVKRLRELLGNERAVVFSEGRVRLNLPRNAVDSWQIEDYANQLPVFDPQIEERVYELYRGEFDDRLSENHAVSIYKARLYNCFCTLIRSVAKYHREHNNPQALMRAYEKALQRDPYNEEFLRGKLEALVLLDRQPEVYDFFASMQKIWQRELGTDLSNETVDAYERALTGDIAGLIPAEH